MKKVFLPILILFLGISNYFGQCGISLSTSKQKFCSDESAILTAFTQELKSIPNFSETKEFFRIKDLNLNQSTISLITDGLLPLGTGYSLKAFKDTTTMYFNDNTELKKVNVTSGKISISITTDLKQDLKVVFELPYFKINGIKIKDSILISGVSTNTGSETFTKTIDLSNSEIDFTSGNINKVNSIAYVITPSFKISTKILSNNETGTLKIDLKDLKYTENVEYKWYFNNTLIKDKITPNIEVNKSGNYKIIISSLNCLPAEKTINLEVVDRPIKNISILGNLTFCDGDSVKLKALGTGAAYLWSDNTTKSNVFKATKSGDYFVNITNDICSVKSDIIKVVVNPKPTLKLNINKLDTTIVIGNKLTLKASGAKEYLWNNQSKLDSIVLKEAGKYSVTGKNEFGCSSSVNFELKLREKGVGLESLNTLQLSISPNPVSEILTVAVDNFKNNTLKIVDLKGNQILTQPLTDNKTEINVNSFAKGIYLVNISDNANTVLNTKRFVVE